MGDANYAVKINFRRLNDQEIRREGWVKFQPNLDDPLDQQYIWDGTDVLIKLAELIQPAGMRVVIGASATQIKAFSPITFQWIVIGNGYNAAGARWQVETINGYLIFNNTVDLPVYYTYGAAAVTPLYELRDVGIASVGRIAEYNGFLFCLNLTYIDSNQLNTWMTGYPNYIPGTTDNENTNFDAPAANSGYEYDITTGASTIVANLLPTTQPLPTWWIILKKVDNAVGAVITTPVLGDQTVVLLNQNDMALIWSDGTNFFAKVFLNGTIPAANPYGIPPPDILNHVQYDVAWSTFGVPTNWAPEYVCYQTSSSANITLPFPSLALKVGDLVGVLGGGPNGGILGGDSTYPLGVPIIAISGNIITLAEVTDAGLSYPVFVTVLRWSDIGTLVGKFSCQGDGSAILGAAKLTGNLIIYKDTSIFIARYQAVVGAPFSFTEKYDGYQQPMFGDCIVSLNGQYHLYPGEGGRFYIFDGLTFPAIHTPTDQARDFFFLGINQSTPAWGVDNPLTKEIWFSNGTIIFAFDYEKNTVGIIDTAPADALFCQRPGLLDKWIVLAIGGNVYTYGLVNGAILIKTWLRDAAPVTAKIGSGLMLINNQSAEKLLNTYVPLLSSASPDMEIEVSLWSTYNPGGGLTSLVAAALLADPDGNNFLPCAFQAIYFQDLIVLVDPRDLDCRFSGRVINVTDVRAGSVTRTSR